VRHSFCLLIFSEVARGIGLLQCEPQHKNADMKLKRDAAAQAAYVGKVVHSEKIEVSRFCTVCV
jgi:hypothetical protein